ncbi:coenzyme F390 synthetase [Aequorivita sublithincola DSM 14238]|uniref:Coenzyme F390 synthetase n=1 Tax=Aequorivita sublithincola (strain DSM 14238 / LMG 21431 / ACAM 643 / 9-3) TaxID=746697 RepID=I3YVN9_AEQSU|nr:acyltransferase [Aequorivita sublithincola]AFL81057.1 coenzyme F390 synthetase [Aequorivita sublithincola DSM 14238]
MLEKEIFDINTSEDFERLALKVFHFQYENVPIYRTFCELLNTKPSEVKSIESIPFLPIQFFKSHEIIAENRAKETIFTSSGTTGSITSKHFVASLELYEKSFLKAFERQYGNPSSFTFLALLPSYLEREGSSLIYMVEKLIEKSNNPNSGFYLNEMDALIEKLESLEKSGQKTILIGVSYALLDLIEMKSFQLKNTIVMETGGMKGRRKEMIKEELHEILKNGFGVQKIHSEYGMTELLSQAYSIGDGIFSCPPWMKILTRDPEDALSYTFEKTGGINVIDLANLYSCSFIATQDLGKTFNDGTFEVLGRFDSSDVRGCNLMVL